VTHVIDTGISVPSLDAALTETGHLIDIVKIGWGIGYIDRHVKARAALCNAFGVTVCLGGTLLELCETQRRVDEFHAWIQTIGVDAIEVSNGLQAMTSSRKRELIKRFAGDFTVFAETGAKDSNSPVVAEQWVTEMAEDLDAGASYVLTEGRESGTVGLFHEDGSVRTELLELITETLPIRRVVFEAPRKSQTAKLIRRFGPDVNVGNIALGDVLSVETLRLGLRSDTAQIDSACVQTSP
jgi:phosphosulfolactate synthase